MLQLSIKNLQVRFESFKFCFVKCNKSINNMCNGETQKSKSFYNFDRNSWLQFFPM